MIFSRRNILFFFLSFNLFTTALVAQTFSKLYEQTDKTALNQWVDSVYSELSLEEKVGQLFMPIVESKSNWKKRISDYINNQKIGGVLFSKGTLSEQAETTNYIQSIARIPLFIALDGEWGLSMRLTDAPKYPRNQIVGAVSDRETLFRYGKEVARQCREMGIHINFAPSLDVHSNPGNPVIGTRSFGENPVRIARQGIAFARGMEENGVMAVAKHFPGHGDTSEDSHQTLPTIPHNADRLDSVELYPFVQYIDSGLSGIMLGHLHVPALAADGLPASLSPHIGQKLLKTQMGFTGLVFTDAMAMKAVSNHPDMSVKALLAGNDMILGVTDQEREFREVKLAVEKGTIPKEMLEEKVRKILSYKYILNVHRFKPIETKTLKRNIHSSQSEWIRQKIYDKATTLIKNDDSLLPITALDKNRIASVAIGVAEQNAFQSWLRRYADVQLFQSKSLDNVSETIAQLKGFQTLIVSIHSAKTKDSQNLQRLLESVSNAVLVLFDSPYVLNRLTGSIKTAKSIVLAYDNTPFAQKSSAQALFGGIGFSGTLPVSAGGFEVSAGMQTSKTRLSYSHPEEVGIISEKLHHIEDIALEGIHKGAYPGCYVLVAKDGAVIYDRGFGNLEYQLSSSKVTHETVYDLASITKAVATVPALMKLYDERKIKLQDKLGKFVPQTAGTDKARITVREALFHETGFISFIPYYTTVIDKNSCENTHFGKESKKTGDTIDCKFIPTFISDKPSDDFPLPVAENLYASNQVPEELLRHIVNTPLKTKRYRYSCLNFILLKEAIENISNTDLNSYLQNSLYRKLGAYATTFRPLDRIPANNIAPTENDLFFRKQQLKGYVHDEGAALLGGISGNAGLFSDANGLAKLSQMWLNGGEYGGERFLSEETVNLFTKTKSNNSRRGLGFDKPDPHSANSPASPLTPVSVYGHTGYTGTCVWVDPDNRMIYIFLSNRVFPARLPNRLSTLKIRERIQDELYKAMK